MKAFLASLNNGSTSGVITPDPPVIIINPSVLADKIYWWLDGVDQIGTSNLVSTETNIALPYSSNLKKATDLISLNGWFTGVTANAIDKNSVSSFCASRQFYNSTTKELIIVKAGQHLSASEEIGLVNYMEVETIHNFDSKTVNLFTRFTNSYSNLEKSKIDNVIRLLDRNDIYNKLDHFYMNCTSKKEEQLLDWINASTNITIPADNVAIVPLRGLAPQTGYFSTNAIPSNDAKMTVNDAFVSIKTFNNPEFNAPNYLFGATGNSSFRFRPLISGGLQIKSYDMQFFTDSKIYFPLGVSKYSDTIVMTKVSNQFTAYRNNDTNHTATVQGAVSFPSTPIAFGGIIGVNAQSNSNYIQHYASGAALTETQAKMLSLITDNFCEGQKALDLGYVQEDGYKVYTFDFDIKDTLGNKCLYQKESVICFSNDLGKTVSAEIPFIGKTLGNIEMCHIFDNGNIIFASSKNVVYKTTWDLLSLEVLQPTKNGVAYNIHTPVNSAYQGEYFKMLCAKNKQYLEDGREIMVWGNYCNVWGGASPTVVWYSFGDEIKVAYEYGQNPYYTDNGVFVSGTGGTLLGDPLSTIKTRHSHGVQQSPDNKNQFFMAHGDFDRAARTDVNGTFPAFFESGFTKFLYNPIADSWTASLELTGTGASRAKSSAVQMPGDGYLYYSSDLSVNDPVAQFPEIGYFRVKYADLNDWNKHERFHLHEQLTKSLNHFHLDNEYFFMGGGYAAGGQSYGLFGDPDIIYSPDMVNYFERILPVAGNSYFYKISKISSKKYLLNAMVTYSYANSFSVVLDFN